MTQTLPIDEFTAETPPRQVIKCASQADQAGTPEPTEAPETTQAAPDEAAETAPHTPLEPARAQAGIFAGVPELLASALERKGFEELTAVQQAVLVPETEGRDLEISSQTGSGKTVAIGFVIAEAVIGGVEQRQDPDLQAAARGPLALVVVPTRELAAQVRSELAWLFGNVQGLKVACVTGGTHLGLERRELSRGPQILVGTPGRLVDHLRNGALSLGSISELVLDEADQMLDMGFREELEAILQATSSERRTHMVSATFPPAIRALAKAYQREPLPVRGSQLGGANADIEHIAYPVRNHDRYASLVNLLLVANLEPGSRTLVFVKTRLETTDVSEKLASDGFAVAPLSGDLPQSQRTRTLDGFRAGRLDVLVATDVAARGLDVPDVATVIHTALPFDSEVYTHRSGRTGRAGQKGRSLVMVPLGKDFRVRRLFQQAKVTGTWERIPTAHEVETLAADQARAAFDARLAEQLPSEARLNDARLLLEKHDAATLVAKLLEESRARGPRAAFEINSVRPRENNRSNERGPGRSNDRYERGNRYENGNRYERGERQERGDRYERDNGSASASEFTRFAINWGFKHGANPKRLLALVCRRGGVQGKLVGSIDIGPNESSFEIAREIASEFDERASQPDQRDPRVVIRRVQPGEAIQARPPRPMRHGRKPFGPRPGASSDRGGWKPNKGGFKKPRTFGPR